MSSSSESNYVAARGRQMVRQIVNHILCLCANCCLSLFLIHTFIFCESTCYCSVLSSPDRHGGNQCSDIFVNRREGVSRRIEREKTEGVIHSIHVLFFLLVCFRSLCPWQERMCERVGVEKDGERREGLEGRKLKNKVKGFNRKYVFH